MTDQSQVKQKEKLISDAQTILGDKNTKPEDILTLAIELHGHDEIGMARKILEQAAQLKIDDLAVKNKIIQKWALSTYKDTHINRKKALELAIDILQQEFDLSADNEQETFGIAGAIYKRKWDIDGIKVHLEQSLIYYKKGYEKGVEQDQGYTAINAAFTLDLLAYHEQQRAVNLGTTSTIAEGRREEAHKIRQQIIDHLSVTLKNIKLEKDNYWPVVTLAEAYFGIGKNTDAKKWLAKAKKIPEIAEWERITTAKQLVHLAKLLPEENMSKAEKVLNEFLDGKVDAIQSMYRGKVGLALSGGGFRASFYHIGVLAKLAELDMLRHVEVLSCVSGGAILGTHYYLELRRLINDEKTKDEQVDRKDFINIVKNIEKNFLLGVQENPRVRVLASPWDNLKMIFSSNYSRTKRLGELYEKLIYSKIEDGEQNSERYLNGLYMYPEGDKTFLPRRDNWCRRCKIPELVLNCTTLNTGHNWQFTASWMGESPTQIDPDVDANDRYRRTYYNDAPEPYKKMRLGNAVSASSCVPGLFEPIVLDGLYEETTVRLIDGGIYDNQGVAGLLEQDCNVIISSDATGQKETEKDPGGGVIKPLLRTNTALIQRVRSSQYQDLKAKETAGILKGFAYVHLKQDLKGEDISWVDSTEAEEAKQDVNEITDYGIRKDIQKLLAGVRTDLDSFSDIEAYALMTSGYCAIEKAVEKSVKEFPLVTNKREKWDFLKVEAAMKQKKQGGEMYDRLISNLQVSPKTFGKIWTLDNTLNSLRTAIIVFFILTTVYIWYSHPGWQPFSGMFIWLSNKLTINAIMWTIGIVLIASLATAAFGKIKAKAIKYALNYQDLPRRILVGGGIGLIGWLGAYIHLRLFDKWFKKFGEIK